MTESKHTPGPWRTGMEHGTVVAGWTGGRGYVVAEGVTKSSDAALIARAPDLLREVEELRAARDEMESLYDSESSLREYAQEFGARMEAENEELRAQNAELLEALESTYGVMLETGLTEAWPITAEAAVAAIAKAKGGAA